MSDIFKTCELVITTNEMKLKLIKNNELRNIKYITKEELKKKFYFDYDCDAIKYIMNNYNIKYDNAKIYIDSMYYIDNIKTSNKVLDEIRKIKNELIDNNLLKFDKNFKYYLINCNVVCLVCGVLDKFYLNMIEEIRKITNVEINNIKDDVNKNKIDVYEFDTITDEILFVAQSIIKLLNNRVNINNIYITNYQDEYENVIKKVFDMHGIPINIKNSNLLFNTNIGKYFFELVNKNISCDEIFKSIEKYVDNNKIDIAYYNKIVDICNEYFKNDKLDKYDIACIKNKLKNTKINTNKLDKAINIIDYNNYIFDDNEYVFLIGFNQGVVPKIYKDEDFLSDKIKSENNLSTSVEMNILEKDMFIKKIYSIKNLIISYKLSSDFDIFYKSNLIDELHMNIISNYMYENIYSNKYNEYLLVKMLDNLVKYGINDNKLSNLYSTYPEIDYLTYDNKFSGIDKEKLNKYLNDKLIISYTHLDNYNRCSFRYYLSNLLKLDKMEETFQIKLGNLYHYILSIAFKENFDFETSFDEYIENIELDDKEIFFINNLKEELLETIDIIKYQETFSELNNAMYEEKVYINKVVNGINVTFMGVIDKVRYKLENNNIYVAIIDYKTGTPKINLDYSKYGINMQLPIYLYLAKNIRKFDNSKINYIGFYLQKICNKTLDSKKDEKSQKIDALKLQGYTVSDINLIEKLDNSYSNSNVIKSMRLSSNGFYKYSKVLNKDQIENLIIMIDEIIKKNIKDILSAKFDINPKRINNINVGCEFCTYKDICYKNETNVVDLENISYEDFL